MPQNDIPDFLGKGGFILCVNGSAEITTPEKCHRLEKGMIFTTTPLVNIVSIAQSPDFKFIMFLDDIKVFYPVFLLISDTGIPMAVRQQPCWEVKPELYDYIIAQAGKIEAKIEDSSLSAKEWSISQAHCELLRQETMLEVLMSRFKGLVAQSDEQNKLNRIAYQFILRLHENYKTQRNVAWYAGQAGLSPGYFADRIRKVSGMSPSRWISTITVTYAKILLEKTDKSIKEISDELHFPEQFTFRKYFKQHTGVAPKSFRKSTRHPLSPKYPQG